MGLISQKMAVAPQRIISDKQLLVPKSLFESGFHPHKTHSDTKGPVCQSHSTDNCTVIGQFLEFFDAVFLFFFTFCTFKDPILCQIKC